MRALLDTCVLVPSLGRDLLLSIAVENVYVPYWGGAILAELAEVIRRRFAVQGRDADAAGYADHLLREMNRAFPDASVPQRYEALVGTFGLPDPDDEHVVAAAVVCGATTIVSDNVKDMPVDKLPDHIQVSVRSRRRSDGSGSYAVLFRERDSGKQTSLTHDDKAEAERMRRVVEANGGDLRRRAYRTAVAQRFVSPARTRYCARIFIA